MPVCRPVGQVIDSVLIVSLEIISVLMVSVLIGGMLMMRVRGFNPPRAGPWDGVKWYGPPRQIFFSAAAVSSCHAFRLPRSPRNREGAESHA